MARFGIRHAYIDLSAMRENLDNVRKRVPGCPVLAIVKSDAYGFGLNNVLPALSTADGYGVALLEEAMALNKLLNAPREKPIVILQGVFSFDALLEAVEHDFTLVVHSEYQLALLERLSEKAQSSTAPLSVWLKINTGMNRLGVSRVEASDFWRRLNQLSYIKPIGVMTHFACADEPDKGQTENQLEHFIKCRSALQPLPKETSAANSAAILNFSNCVSGWLRPGIMLYGGSPIVAESVTHTVGNDIDAKETMIKPVMTLEARVIAVQKVKKRESVGYGASFVASHDSTVAVVSMGYGDGYPRHIGAQNVFIRGRLCPIVGRISMDMMTVDISSCPSANIGDKVELWGKYINVDDVAKSAGTISYELFCQLTSRVQRMVA